MSPITLKSVRKCEQESPWRVANESLYSLCRQYPDHRESDAVLAKILLIGRSYAAAIERRKDKDESNDDFYNDRVAPAMCRSKIDAWIKSAAKFETPSVVSMPTILAAHENVTKLFKSISGLEKRSLASKYLHFHLPNLFFIYDSRVVRAMRSFSSIVGKVGSNGFGGDKEYSKFAEKCFILNDYITDRFKITLTPRQIDNLLLEKSKTMLNR